MFKVFNFKRFIDGVFLGNIAYFFYYLGFLKKKINKEKIKSIAFIKLVGMGDGVLQLPSLYLFKKANPNINLTIIATSVTAAIFAEQHFIDRIVVLKQNPTLFLQILSLRKSFSLAIDAEPFMNLSFIIAKWFAPWTVGFSNTLRKVSHDTKVDFMKDVHMTENYQNLFVPFFKKQQIKKYLPLQGGSEVKKVILQKWRAWNIFFQKNIGNNTNYSLQKSNTIAIAIGSGKVALGRRLPLMTYIGIIKKILATYPEKVIFLIGGPIEVAIGEKVVQEVQHLRLINTIGTLSLAELFELLKKIGYFIGNDTGTAHIAVAQECRSLIVFGPETENRYGPLPVEKKHLVLNRQLLCSPCISIWQGKNQTCANPICTQQITSEFLFEQLKTEFF